MRNKTNNKLKKLHIFDEVWCIGKPNKTSDHAIIYGPDDKEYHLDKQWISFLFTHEDSYWDDGVVITNRWNLGRVKAYILSNIIDPGLWVYNTDSPPPVRSNVKVIYTNGTVKWIEFFEGEFNDHILGITYQAPIQTNPEWLKWHYNTKKDGKMPSQMIWKTRVRKEKVLAWRLK